MRLVLLALCLRLAEGADPNCVIDLRCEECLPENMPEVTSPPAANGSVAVAAGGELLLHCGAGRFAAYPLRARLAATCHRGRYRVRHDGELRHLLELGCQENIFEDVLHQVDGCPAPLQGRAYRTRAADGARHLAALCFDADRAVAVHLLGSSAPHNALQLAPHAEQTAPLSLLGNFNHMFDIATRHEAERLYSDEARLDRRLRELLKHDDFPFAEQRLTSAELLAAEYFEEQNARVAAFVSNRVAAWASVARGNLRHVQRGVGRLARARALLVRAGARGVLALRAGAARAELFLRAGRRFPVPRYVWTAVHDQRANRALVVVVLNDPFVAVSEIEEAAFCESVCERVSWLPELVRLRNYEVPLLGLTYCCSAADAARRLLELARLAVPPGEAGMLIDLAD